jgi:hypothetical protein
MKMITQNERPSKYSKYFSELLWNGSLIGNASALFARPGVGGLEKCFVDHDFLDN